MDDAKILLYCTNGTFNTYVPGQGSNDAQRGAKLVEALDDANAGDTVVVPPGGYKLAIGETATRDGVHVHLMARSHIGKDGSNPGAVVSVTSGKHALSGFGRIENAGSKVIGVGAATGSGAVPTVFIDTNQGQLKAHSINHDGASHAVQVAHGRLCLLMVVFGALRSITAVAQPYPDPSLWNVVNNPSGEQVVPLIVYDQASGIVSIDTLGLNRIDETPDYTNVGGPIFGDDVGLLTLRIRTDAPGRLTWGFVPCSCLARHCTPGSRLPPLRGSLNVDQPFSSGRISRQSGSFVRHDDPLAYDPVPLVVTPPAGVGRHQLRPLDGISCPMATSSLHLPIAASLPLTGLSQANFWQT